MDTVKSKHWTSSTIDNFVFQIAADFILQLDKKLEAGPISNKELADRLEVSAGRVSQVLNTPGNFKLRSMTEYARALNLKLTVVAYDDGDPDNDKGPINSEVFYECWKRQGKPRDFYDLSKNIVVHPFGYGVCPIAATSEGTNYKWLPSIPEKSVGTVGSNTITVIN